MTGTLWDHSFLSYAADEQTDRQTVGLENLTHTYRHSRRAGLAERSYSAPRRSKWNKIGLIKEASDSSERWAQGFWWWRMRIPYPARQTAGCQLYSWERNSNTLHACLIACRCRPSADVQNIRRLRKTVCSFLADKCTMLFMSRSFCIRQLAAYTRKQINKIKINENKQF